MLLWLSLSCSKSALASTLFVIAAQNNTGGAAPAASPMECDLDSLVSAAAPGGWIDLDVTAETQPVAVTRVRLTLL
jgi:hypothetical protein